MMNVPNKGCIRRLSLRTFRAARLRNLIAVIAIALTTLMFTSLFTIGMSIVASYEQQNFRQAGGYGHASFKDVTEAQMLELADDPHVVEWGSRLMVGMPSDVPFNKSHVEVSYMDANNAKTSFAVPTHGALPREGTNEAVTDTRVLALLGVTPELGAEFTMTYELGANTMRPTPVTQTFTLSGWYDYDPANIASMVIMPRSLAEETLAGYVPVDSTDMTGKWTLNVMFKNANRISDTVDEIIRTHGYQNENPGLENYIGTGVNWGYVGAQMSDSFDFSSLLAVVALLLLIILTGYLIIYNIFMISVTNDIRFYGLLKTIGTTSRQLRRIIRTQALLLSAIGIPIGLLAGHFIGASLTPAVMENLSYKTTTISTSPVIFIGAALFSLVTVLISCRKPGKIAGRVSAIEAVRYTEGSSTVKKSNRRTRGARVSNMARANLGRSRGKTLLVVLSLSLSVVLLTATFTFTNGFDMEKYLRRNAVTDFIFGHADYFQTGVGFTNSDQAVTEDLIEEINAQCNVTAGGRIYGQTMGVQEYVTEDWYRTTYSRWNPPEVLDQKIAALRERAVDGRIEDRAQLYGMEPLALDHLTVFDGDLSKLYEPGPYIAAVYNSDDYNNTDPGSHWAKVGDTVKLRYVTRWEYRDSKTGALIADPDSFTGAMESVAVEYTEKEYTVAACVTVPSNEGYRFYGADQYVLNSETFQQDSGTASIMTYLFDVQEGTLDETNAFLSEYTETVQPLYDFESKQIYIDQFNSFRSMFLLMGGALSLIMGLIGVLNFINAVLTSILTRRREFAVLESIGMTGRQLRQMLVYEGLFYAGAAVVVSFGLSFVLGPILRSSLEQMFWFFTYHYTVAPMLIVLPIFFVLGVCIPLVAYRAANKTSIVDRIREAE